MAEDDFARVKRLSSWKKRIKRAWNNINVVECNMFDNGSESFEMDHAYEGKSSSI